MYEAIYNILYFVNSEPITHAAICLHHVTGSDQEKSERLRSAVASDLAEATPVPLPKPISHDTFMALQRLGRHLEVFEPLFQAAGAAREPFCCVTAVVDGHPTVDIRTDHSPLAAEVADDWLRKYATEDGFDLPRLLNDDYFRAIRFLFNAQEYVSCMKLLVSFIDTIAFLAHGNARAVFVKWLDTHVVLDRLGITAAELWELRNGLLHMTTLDSHKVARKSVRRIGFCVAPRGICSPASTELAYFNLLDLIDAVANGISHWTKHINDNREEFVHFVERYDRIVRTQKPQQSPPSDSGKAAADGGPAGAPEG